MEVEPKGIDLEVVNDLASFFDALARYDFEDNQAVRTTSKNNPSDPNS